MVRAVFLPMVFGEADCFLHWASRDSILFCALTFFFSLYAPAPSSSATLVTLRLRNNQSTKLMSDLHVPMYACSMCRLYLSAPLERTTEHNARLMDQSSLNSGKNYVDVRADKHKQSRLVSPSPRCLQFQTFSEPSPRPTGSHGTWRVVRQSSQDVFAFWAVLHYSCRFATNTNERNDMPLNASWKSKYRTFGSSCMHGEARPGHSSIWIP